MNLGIIITFSVIIAIALYIFILPDSKRPSLNKVLRVIHDFLKIKTLMIENIFRFVYVVAVIFSILFGFYYLFSTGAEGLLIIIFGPFVCRIVFEMMLLAVILVREVMEINSRLKRAESKETSGQIPADTPSEGLFSGIGEKLAKMVSTQASPATPDSTRICKECGKPIADNSQFCIYCGKKVED